MEARRRMCSRKHKFLKTWIMGLQICRSMKKDTTILERKNAITLSADVAMVSTRDAATHWSRALLDDVVSRSRSNKKIVELILGHKLENRASSSSRSMACRRISRSRRSHIAREKARRVVAMSSSSIAERLVKKRTQVLRQLVPGGEEMDGVSLIQETLDYIVALRLQVDVMRRLATAAAPSR